MDDTAHRVRLGLREALAQAVSTPFKPATFWDTITIQLPQAWKCVREPDGMWECYERDDKEMETIWVDYDVFRSNDHHDKSDDQFFAEMASSANVIGQAPINPTASRKVISASPAHTIVNVTWTSNGHDDDATEIYNSAWHHIGASRPFCAIVHLKLIAPSRLLGDENYAALVRALDHSLMNASIHWERLCPPGP